METFRPIKGTNAAKPIIFRKSNLCGKSGFVVGLWRQTRTLLSATELLVL
jgi:hypothetical protein